MVFVQEENGKRTAYPDTLVGTDSHTTMINGLGVLGWGVGGIEAEAAMLGQPVSMLIPQVVGVKLTGKLHEGATATDLVLTITEMLRSHGVVGKFVEFFGPGLQDSPWPTAPPSPTCRPSTARPAEFSGGQREPELTCGSPAAAEEQIALVEAYCREQGLVPRRENAGSANTPNCLLWISPPSSKSGRTQASAGSRDAVEGGRIFPLPCPR